MYWILFDMLCCVDVSPQYGCSDFMGEVEYDHDSYADCYHTITSLRGGNNDKDIAVLCEGRKTD